MVPQGLRHRHGGDPEVGDFDRDLERRLAEAIGCAMRALHTRKLHQLSSVRQSVSNWMHERNLLCRDNPKSGRSTVVMLEHNLRLPGPDLVPAKESLPAATDNGLLTNDQATKHRHDRLRLYGPGTFERISQSQQLLRPRISARAEGRLCSVQRQGTGFRQHLGLRVGRDRLEEAARAKRYRRG